MPQSNERILVINPNSTQAVTDGIDRAMEPLRMPGGPEIECVTLKEGPPGIETQAHVESVVAPISAAVKSRDNDCSAFVIACYSDPGLHAAREITTKPVLGIAECGILAAMTLGQRFGVISILKKSIPRHLRYVGQMGVADRMAGDRAIGLGVVELADETRTFSRMAEVAAELRDLDGADVLIMGCAGMARYRDRLQCHVGLPVVEPSQAAVARLQQLDQGRLVDQPAARAVHHDGAARQQRERLATKDVARRSVEWRVQADEVAARQHLREVGIEHRTVLDLVGGAAQ